MNILQDKITSKAKRWALITGASAGIGTEFAKQLAADNFNLVLVARREDRLQQLAEQLEKEYSAQSLIISVDLAIVDSINLIQQQLQAHGITVHTLVNNAGYGVTGRFNHVKWQVHADFMQVMVSAVIQLSYALLPSMQTVGTGQIINIASLAGVVPAPAGHTLYAASKAFLIKFSEALALENEDKGIKVQALCPGFTYTEFHDVTKTREQVSEMPQYMWMSATEVVSESLHELTRKSPRIVLINGKVNRFIARLMRWLPQKFALNMIRKRGKEFRSEN